MPLGWLAGAALVGSAVSAIGANSAANTQADAQKQAAQTQLDMFNKITGQEQPFLQSGYGATSALNYLLGIGGNTSSGGAGAQPLSYNAWAAQQGGGGGTGGAPTSLAGILQGGPGGTGTRAFDPSGHGLTVGANGATVPGADTSQAAYQKYVSSFGNPAAAGGGAPPGGVGGLPAGFLTQQFNPTQEQLDQYPGYQFALKTGQTAIRNQDTPGSGALSGAALKDLMNFDVGTANQYYGQYFNQFQTQQNNIFNRLNSIASLGQNAAGNLGSAGTSLGTGIAQAQAAAGGSLAAGTIGAANAIGGGLNNAASLNYLLSNSGSNAPLQAAGASAYGDAGASTLDSFVSDRRLKKNIRRIGSTPGGQPWYEFEYTFEPGRREGVMADESPPEAVRRHASGYLMVDYGRIR